jgi:hypothetical protein
MPHTEGRLYDQRLDEDEARALLARRINPSVLRYRKEAFGLPADAKLSDHADLQPVVGATTSMATGRPYRTLQWGVFVNGHYAGYVTQKLRWRGRPGEETSYVSSKLWPYGGSRDEVYDPAVHGEPVQR